MAVLRARSCEPIADKIFARHRLLWRQCEQDFVSRVGRCQVARLENREQKIENRNSLKAKSSLIFETDSAAHSAKLMPERVHSAAAIN